MFLSHVSCAQWLLFFRASGTLLAVEALLRALTLPRCCRVLGVGAPDQEGRSLDQSELNPASDQELLMVAEAVRRAYRYACLPDTCLRRSLTAGALLSRREPTLRLGVHKQAGVLTAHAWLEIDGQDFEQHLRAEGGRGSVPDQVPTRATDYARLRQG